ncbi:phosphorylase [Antarcticibacterium arcticum]|uniref:Uridine phosphorylase n=1 Tax=Antarcticibacterium arcticum TaxID=2585771 RepID=A0A5B8YG42_9FLAO|nr:nucleoside phosphorylase [Antarcticibacterium arcticum]QED36952.1 phosphorylase [Antarcticibacterium arcticum]
MNLKASEFIQNSDGSIYHLNLLPQHLATTVITVGDQDRVQAVTKYFDKVEFKIQKREFHTQTGTYKGKRISVVSTGIGTDNIDIVYNELDALVNIDFETRTVKENLTSLDIIRIGTSGAIQPEIPVDSFLVSLAGIGFDSMLHFYEVGDVIDKGFSQALVKDLNYTPNKGVPYVVNGDTQLASWFKDGYHSGVTLTNCGFYGPQGRVLRLQLQDPELNDKIAAFNYKGQKITNLEMETAGMYGLSKLLGHRSISLNAIVANRATGEFSRDSKKTVDHLIKATLDNIIAN